MNELDPRMLRSAALPADFPTTNFGGDFLALLGSRGLRQPQMLPTSAGYGGHNDKLPITEGTTVLALKYKDGVIVAGDRRATAGNMVVYDRADKVLQIDDFSILAIAGVPAMAWEVARVLQQTMSVEGKVRALSKLLRDNLPMALQGVGIVVPIFATAESNGSRDGGGRLYFYDALGAQFEGTDYCASGSGSPAVKSVAYYLNNWGPRPFAKMAEQEAITVALRLLDTAAEGDTATGGYNRRSNIFPIVKLVSRDGVREVQTTELNQLYRQRV